MDSDIFNNWVEQIDHKFTANDRRVVLVVDNCPAHPEIHCLQAIDLNIFTTQYDTNNPAYGPK